MSRDSWQKLDAEHRFTDLSDYARPVALAVVAALRPTRVRSVHVTGVFLAVGLAAAWLVALGGGVSLVWAGILLQLKNLLDAVDGSLARAQDRPSRVGRYFDSVADLAVHLAVHAAVAVALSSILPPWLAWVLSGATALASLLQCSYYSFFTVAYRRLHRDGVMSRLDEREAVRETGSRPERLFQALYDLAYGWQDRWVQARVRSALRPAATAATVSSAAEPAPGIPALPFLFTRAHLTTVSLFGLGLTLLLLALACWASAWTGSAVPFGVYAALVLGPGNVLLGGDLLRLCRVARQGTSKARP
jgi:phosphatidylglycerophosphate synthase